jgi:AAA15 family ATPase/GTPase
MIQEMSVQNFLSFKEKKTISFEATKDATFEDNQVVTMKDGTRLLRFAMVYGANASGKSNLLSVFDFLCGFLFNKPKDLNEETGVEPFLLDDETPKQPSEFSLRFYVDETRYWYRLSLTNKVVLKEELYLYKSVQPTRIFERKYEDGQSVLNFNPAVVTITATAKEQISLACLPNMSVFAARNQVNISIPEIDAAKDELKRCIMPNIAPQSRMFDYASEEIAKDQAVKSYLLDFLRKADFNITNVKSEEEKAHLPKLLLNILLSSEEVSEEEKEQLRTDDEVSNYKTMFQHTVKNSRGTEQYLLSGMDQSAGTRRILGIEAAIYSAMKGNAFINVDEIESSLHPELVEFIIQKFLEEKNRAQLLITTHYDPLLDTVGDDMIRKDSVWFTEKAEDGSTDLYSLVDFKGLNRLSSIRKAYRNGQFGALPVMQG